jgi:hypothetical protein
MKKPKRYLRDGKKVELIHNFINWLDASFHPNYNNLQCNYARLKWIKKKDIQKVFKSSYGLMVFCLKIYEILMYAKFNNLSFES